MLNKKKKQKNLIAREGGAAPSSRLWKPPAAPETPDPAPEKPAPYVSANQDQISALTQALADREDFSYDSASDPLYQQYRDQYIQGGRMAMQDTMGQAAALTGGYANSYAATAGNQAYQGYLSGLNDRALDLYDRAYAAYQQEGSLLARQLELLSDQEARDYQRYRDSVADWQDQRDHDYQVQQDLQDQENWQAEYDYRTRKWRKRRKGGGSATGNG